MHRHPERSGLTLGGADFDGLRAPGSVSIELALRVTPARPSHLFFRDPEGNMLEI